MDVGIMTRFLSLECEKLSLECGCLCVRSEMERMTQRKHLNGVACYSYAKLIAGARHALIQQAV